MLGSVSLLARNLSSSGSMSAAFIQWWRVVGGISCREAPCFAEHFEFPIQEKSKWQLLLYPRGRLLAIFMLPAGEGGCSKSQKIWCVFPAALPFSLKGNRISQILGRKTKTPNPLPDLTEVGITTFLFVKWLPGLPAVCRACAAPPELLISRRSQDRLRGRQWPEGRKCTSYTFEAA